MPALPVPEESVEAVARRRYEALWGPKPGRAAHATRSWENARSERERFLTEAREDLEAAAPVLREQVREALMEQADEYRREASEARQRGEQGGWEKLSAAADVVECVTRIIFDSNAHSDQSKGERE